MNWTWNTKFIIHDDKLSIYWICGHVESTYLSTQNISVPDSTSLQVFVLSIAKSENRYELSALNKKLTSFPSS